MKIIFLLIALTIAACTQPPPAAPVALSTQPPNESLRGYGTLSHVGDPIDMASSVVYTRLAMYRDRALFALQNNNIGVYEAEQAQYAADAIRSQLDWARKHQRLQVIQTLSDQLDAQIADIEGKIQ